MAREAPLSQAVCSKVIMSSYHSYPARTRAVALTRYLAAVALAGVSVGGAATVTGCAEGSPPDSSTDEPSPLPQDSGKPHGDEPMDSDPGTAVEVEVATEALTAINQQLDEVQELDAAGLVSKYAVEFSSELGFDPLEAMNFDLIQASSLALSEQQRTVFQQHGFVISDSSHFATFSYGYHSIYGADLPVYVSADSVLDAVHRSYSDVLKALEGELLVPTLQSYLAGMRSALGSNTTLSADVRRHADFFLAVPESLLSDTFVSPSFDDSFETEELAAFVNAARAAEGIHERELFGVKREFDFSQFKPRGHYTDSPELSRYFQAMMWLGRVDLRLVETLGNGERVLRRPQVEAMLALHELMDAPRLAQWELIDRVVTSFVGEHDYMNVPQVSELTSALGVTDSAELDHVADDTLAQVILEGQFGEQRIASHVIRKKDVFGPTLPLNASFALFGQRYVVDSHVFSQVVFDRVADRVLPNPLDAAFAALGNNHAAHLLQPELEQFDFSGNLAAMRVLVDAHPLSSWNSSLYTGWLGALRELSAKSEPAGSASAQDLSAASADAPGLPAVAKSEAWGRRLLNTQLGSWAQLRHDTLLYAKQSYTAGDECEFPDAYVDPYPQFWARLVQYAEQGASVVLDLEQQTGGSTSVLARAAAYFQRLAETAGNLHRMSEHQLTGVPHSAQDVQFINNAVRISDGASGPPSIEGWYHQLLFNPEAFTEVDNVVADVHTDPGGITPPRDPNVLHVGTGYPRLMVVAVETCNGPRAYAGPVFSYKEYLPGKLHRLNDEEWVKLLESTDAPSDPEWLQPVVAP